MRTKPAKLGLFLAPLCAATGSAAPISNLTFTDVVKDVVVINVESKKETPAKAGDVLVPPNVLKTGPDSRAELIAEDKTVTRVGANTIFSVEASSRDVNLTQGSVLFHSPAGRGGGRIKSAGATASVLGTTLVVSASSSGGFKTSLLEGKGQITGAKGGKVPLAAGQLAFAQPGKGLSKPLNFDLKANVAGSKLVGGFSKPLASLAKIEAAIAVQQAKIASGALGDTGLLIGDRPDTAFKVDVSSIQSVVTSVLQQQAAAEETQTYVAVDPRYLEAVQASLKLENIASQTTGHVTPETLALLKRWEDLIFSIDGSGKASMDNYGVAGVPSALPGDRQPLGTMYAALIANNLEIKLPLSSVTSATEPLKATTIPLQIGRNLDSDATAAVALQDLSLSGAIDFIANEATPDGTPSGRPLLLSAGRTILLNPGSVLRSDSSLFEIYAAGSGYSADKDLAERLDAVRQPLSWNGVALLNAGPLDESAPGQIRITAPSIDFKDVLVLTADTNSSIAIEAEGAINLNNSGKTGTVSTATSNLLLSLGLDDPTDLAIKAFNVSIQSKKKAVSINGTTIFANNLILGSGESLSLNGIQVNSFDHTSDQTIKALAEGVINVANSQFPTVVNSSFISTVPAATGSASPVTGITISDSVIGSDKDSTSPDNKTSFVAKATQAALLVKNSQIFTDNLELFGGTDVTVEAVTVTPTDSNLGTVSMTAGKGDLNITKSTTVTAYTINVSAGNNLTITDSNFASKAPSSTQPPSSFSATAGNQLTLSKVALSDAQAVALKAQTVVLGDVTFREGSDIALTSKEGILVTRNSISNPLPGKVNIAPNVKYGSSINLHDLSKVTDPALNSAAGLTNTQFHAAAQAQFGNSLPKINISAK